MAKNYVQSGRSLTVTAPYQRNGGQAALIGAVVGIALSTVANGVQGQFEFEGVWDVDKVAGQAWTEGALIYWDNTAKLFTSVSTSNTRAGWAAAVAVNPSSTGRVRLNGMAAPTGA